MIESSMQNNLQPSPQAHPGQDDPFTIQLTRKQALFLATLLPLRYSLHPQRKKKGPKTARNTANSTRRTNLPPRTPLLPSPAKQPTGSSSQMPRQSPPKRPPPLENSHIPTYPGEETASMQDWTSGERKVEGGCEGEWRLQFLGESRQYPLFVKAYGGVLDLLEERSRRGEVSEEEFTRTIASLFSDANMRKTQRGREVAEKFKALFLKHKNQALSIKKPAASPRTPPPKEEKKYHLPPVLKVKQERRTDSESSEDLGVDFDLNQYKCSSKPVQFGEGQFMQAAYISRNLRKISLQEALAILAKYSIPAIDVLKIKALPSNQLSSLKSEVKALKKYHPHSISDSQQSGRGSVESSFQLEDD